MHSRLGPKRTLPEGTEEEALELDRLYDDLRTKLSLPRTDRLAGRALATWDPDEKAVHVLRKDGKFDNFGYSRAGKFYLENFEALFLLEMNRLQLEYHSTIMSVEQAYLLLLGESASTKFNDYLVYSHLTRAGYILVRHQNVSYYDNVEPTEVDCAWALALSVINSRAIAESVKKSPHFVKVKMQMKHIKECIMKQEVDKQNVEEVTPPLRFDRKIASAGKRKVVDNEVENPTEAKRRCFEVAARQQSFLDCLKDDPEYKQFEECFAKIDFIKLKSYTESERDDDEIRNFQIIFDLYLPNDGFKKSAPKPPKFRLLIIDSNEPFPTHAEITHTYNLQKYPVPLLVVTVGEAKQVQAFLYYFS